MLPAYLLTALRQSFTQDMADPEQRASVAALSNLPARATTAGGQAVAGYLFDGISLTPPFPSGVFGGLGGKGTPAGWCRSGERLYHRGQRGQRGQQQHRGAQPPAVEEPVQPATGDRTRHNDWTESDTE